MNQVIHIPRKISAVPGAMGMNVVLIAARTGLLTTQPVIARNVAINTNPMNTSA
jgi:hypothetical protein